MTDEELAENVFRTIWPNTSPVNDPCLRSIRNALPQLRELFRPQIMEDEIEKAAMAFYDSRHGRGHFSIQLKAEQDYIRNSCRSAFAAIGLYTPPKPPSPGEQFVKRLDERFKNIPNIHAEIAAELDAFLKEREAAK